MYDVLKIIVAICHCLISPHHYTYALQIPQHTNHCTRIPQYYHRSSTLIPCRQQQTLLLSSPSNNINLDLQDNNNNNVNGEGDKSKSPKRRKQPIQTIKRAILSFVNLLITAPAKFKLYVSKLTKRGKIILAVQLMALGLVMGMGIKTTTNAQMRAANRPVEVGYSTFLDLVNVNGKGHTPGKNPALKLSNVIITKDRVGFKVLTDTEKHAKALLDTKLVKANDVAVREIPLSQKSIYAMKPIASQDLIDTLREHEVPFRAASMKASNNMASIARFSIFAVYLLFLRKMYQTMNGGGQQGSGGPGKLATFTNGEPLVKFDDIEGIDDAKFEVMELVDTLRNPKKYEILGARAPTGLLLEGPPGTGELYAILFSFLTWKSFANSHTYLIFNMIQQHTQRQDNVGKGNSSNSGRTFTVLFRIRLCRNVCWERSCSCTKHLLPCW